MYLGENKNFKYSQVFSLNSFSFPSKTDGGCDSVKDHFSRHWKIYILISHILPHVTVIYFIKRNNC